MLLFTSTNKQGKIMPKYLYKQKMSNQANIRLSDDDFERFMTRGRSEYIRKLIADDRAKEERKNLRLNKK